MGVISETLKSMRSTHKRSLEFEKTDERRRGEAFEKEKVIVKDFSFPVNLRRLPGGCCRVTSTLLHGPRAADSPAWGFAATPLGSDTAEGRSLQTQTLLCFFFLFLLPHVAILRYYRAAHWVWKIQSARPRAAYLLPSHISPNRT